MYPKVKLECDAKAHELARINDEFRHACDRSEIVLSNRVSELSPDTLEPLIQRIREFDDPDGFTLYHDIIIVTHDAVRYVAYVKYYDRATGDPFAFNYWDRETTSRKLHIRRRDE